MLKFEIVKEFNTDHQCMVYSVYLNGIIDKIFLNLEDLTDTELTQQAVDYVNNMIKNEIIPPKLIKTITLNDDDLKGNMY